MLKQIWQWLKGLFRRLFGGGTSSRAASYRERINAAPSRSLEETRREAPPLSDSDYEYLFRQLLEGVAHGWNQQRVAQWFEGLKGRISSAEWVDWLRRFGERVLASPAPNDELGMRLVYLGEQAQSIASLREIGDVAYDIGRQLLNRGNASGVVWEYEGPDGFTAAPPPMITLTAQQEEQLVEEPPGMETITLDELLTRLQQDPTLVQLIAQQLGIETNDPDVIIQELVNQFHAASQSSDEAQA